MNRKPRNWNTRTGKRSPLKRVIGALTATVILIGGLLSVSPPPPAEASSLGVGVAVTIPSSGGAYIWFGTHNTSPGGIVTYCAEFNIYPTTSFSQTDAGFQGSGFVTRSADTQGNPIQTKTLTATDMTKLNYILSIWGDTTSANQAAAVAYAVWSITTNSTVWTYELSRPWFQTGIAPFKALGDTMLSDAANYAATAPNVTSGTASLSFNVDGVNNYDGTLTIDTLSPSPSSGIISLVNGTFVSTGTSSISSASFTQGQVLAVHGVPPAPPASYKMNASASFDGGYSANVHVYDTGTRQHLFRAGQRITMNATATDPFDRTVAFQPILTSQVAERYLETGDNLVDTVTFAIQPDANGVVNEWVQDNAGNYMQVVAEGTVYGPFATPQTQSGTVPPGAPVAGTATVTTTAADGPTVSYTATASNPATGAGYYIWVWSIDYDDQPVLTQTFLPQPNPGAGLDGYFWSDDFAVANETSVVVPGVVTNATATGITGYPISDTATITGAVYQGAQLSFAAYLQNSQTPTCDAGTLAFSSPAQAVSAPGNYQSAQFTPSTPGTYFWVAFLWGPNAAGTGTVLAWAGECGATGEVSDISAFTLVTTATQDAISGETATDTARISGVVPTDSSLTFSAYYGVTNTPVCSESNRVFTSTTPTSVPAGFYDGVAFESEPFDTEGLKAGYLFWVETLTPSQGGTVREGVCGASGEVTLLGAALPPTLTFSGANVATIQELGLAGGGSVILGGGALVFLWVRNRRKPIG